MVFLGWLPGWGEWALLGFLALLVFGPRRLPEIAEALGRSITRFKKAAREVESEVKQELSTGDGDTGHQEDEDKD